MIFSNRKKELVNLFLKFKIEIHFFICVCVHSCAPLEVRGQLAGFDSLFHLVGSGCGTLGQQA